MNLRKLRLVGVLLVAVCAGTKTSFAQDASKQEGRGASEGASKICGSQKQILPQDHRFGDQENRWLFAGIGAARTLDYFSTLNMRQRGRQEIFLTNDLVENHPAFAVVEAATAGTSFGASYLFHRYGHHKLERWTSFVHIGLTTTGAVRNYCLKTAHPKTSP